MGVSLHSYGVFKQFDKSELKLLESVMTTRKLPCDAFLFTKGEAARECYFLLEGQVTVGIESPQGFQTLATLNQGEIFGELALLDGGGRSASCKVSSSHAHVGILSRTDFDLVFNSGNPIAYSLLDLISERLIDRVRGAVVELAHVIDAERESN